MKSVKAIHVAFNHSRIAIVDSKGRIWERFVDMDIGTWGLIPLPEEPRPVQHRRASKRER
jgi:hypothetical protein